jgi:predicted RNase H-like HicB family nuclease
MNASFRRLNGAFGWIGSFPKTIAERKVKPMKFVNTLERDEEDVWVAECPSIPGCVSQGQTRDEALANIREAIAACLEVRAERGLPLTIVPAA